MLIGAITYWYALIRSDEISQNETKQNSQTKLTVSFHFHLAYLWCHFCFRKRGYCIWRAPYWVRVLHWFGRARVIIYRCAAMHRTYHGIRAYSGLCYRPGLYATKSIRFEHIAFMNIFHQFSHRSLPLPLSVADFSTQLSACWWAIYLYFINSKAKSTSMNQRDALYSLRSFRLQLSVCFSFVCCDVSIAVKRITMQMTHVTENWIINRKRMALLVHLLKPFACFSHVICCCCASHSFTQVRCDSQRYRNLRFFQSISNSIGISLFLHFGSVFLFFSLLLLLRIGFELSFYSGVYSPSIGFTLRFGESAKQLVGLSGICIGIGEISGGVLFGLLGSRTIKYGRDPIVIVGFIVHLLSFLLIYLNLPNDAPC